MRELRSRRASGVTVVVAAVCLAASTHARPQSQPRASVRFHHFHFQVADPARAMNDAAASFKGTRVLLRGLGVGARIGTEYVLFDRLDTSDVTARTHRSAGDAYTAARSWLVDHGVDVESN